MNFAAHVLIEGPEQKPLIELAGLLNPGEERIQALQRLAEGAFAALDVDIPSNQDAAVLVVRRVYLRIASGEFDAVEGAIWIENHIYNRVEDSRWLIPFVGPASECERVPDQKEFLSASDRKSGSGFLNHQPS